MGPVTGFKHISRWYMDRYIMIHNQLTSQKIISFAFRNSITKRAMLDSFHKLILQSLSLQMYIYCRNLPWPCSSILYILYIVYIAGSGLLIMAFEFY